MFDLVEKIKKSSKGKMADSVICATGMVKPMQTALNISGRRATIIYFGLPRPDDVITVPILDSLLIDKTIRFSWLSLLTWAAGIQSVTTGLVEVKKTHSSSLQSRGYPQRPKDY